MLRDYSFLLTTGGHIRLSLRDTLLAKFNESFHDPHKALELDEVREQLRSGSQPVVPFHWEIEFPEVFNRDNSGFDAFVGNPPFAGKNTLINGNRASYLDWLKNLHPESHGNSDLVAHFFRRAFDALRSNGTFGLIATNTIGQGDTRTTGLRWICTRGGTIFAARKRVKWPGQAAVVVSVVHVAKAELTGPYELGGQQVPIITAYLFHDGGHETPATLRSNAGKSFQGSIILGMGFTFDDTDTKGVASPISLMHELISKDSRNSALIFPYIGGEEVNDSPTHQHHRYVINFGDMTEEEARCWPDLMQVVEKKVKPDRLKQKDTGGQLFWWRYLRPRSEMQLAIKHMQQILVINCGATPHMSFTFLPTNSVFANTLAVISMNNFGAFCTLQSRSHEVWARRESSSMKDDLRYTPTDCFETFPFPVDFETNENLELAGKEYYEFRAALLVHNNEGLTKTYNRFHDPAETSPDIHRLRELHTVMDKAVLDAYGWDDIPTECQFILDYDDEDDEETGGRRRKKPWRYRWPDHVRDEVLARLLKLNAERAEEERHAGLVVAESAEAYSVSSPAVAKRGRKKQETPQGQGELF